ncbi:hypothetical protein HB772_29085 (plasmid) [Sinorhizobium meliloti]|nr:hypothetical protein HB772_29085 [Sinorhizobium meliloti]
MRILLMAAIAAAVAISSSAYAQEVPRYDVPGYCQGVANVSGGSSMIYNGCIDMEQEAYDSLKLFWSATPSRARNYCDEVARVSGSSYSILKGCLDMESDAASNTQEFKY